MKGVGYANVVRGGEAGGEIGAGKVVSNEEVMEVLPVGKLFVPKYNSTEEDVMWACSGLVVTVLNGEAIPILQRQIFDADFEKLDIIPLGADKVLLRMEDGGDVSSIFTEAADFF